MCNAMDFEPFFRVSFVLTDFVPDFWVEDFCTTARKTKGREGGLEERGTGFSGFQYLGIDAGVARAGGTALGSEKGHQLPLVVCCCGA